ncbi:MAG: hypothetical protein RLY31_2535 [Bacteroidota bacterium]|jgi:hypothetical protein
MAMEQRQYRRAIDFGQLAKQMSAGNRLAMFDAFLDSVLYVANKESSSPTKAMAAFESFHRDKYSILIEKPAAALLDLQESFELKGENLTI